MATINQSPSGQASVTLSGISFNGITATATPVRVPARFTVQGGSVAISFGSVNVTTEALIAGMVSVINPLGITEITASANLPPSVVNLDEENLVAVADDIQSLVVATNDNGSRLTIVGA